MTNLPNLEVGQIYNVLCHDRLHGEYYFVVQIVNIRAEGFSFKWFFSHSPQLICGPTAVEYDDIKDQDWEMQLISDEELTEILLQS